jgi:endonuclease/exonuclease/phosphatase family metal-dependent hydrolase
MGRNKLVWLVGGMSLVLVCGLFAVFMFFGHVQQPNDCLGLTDIVNAADTTPTKIQGFDSEQVSIAKQILDRAAARTDIPDTNKEQAVKIAFTAGLTESGLHNVNYGTGTSVGIWQMTPGAYWGSRRQIMHIPYAIDRFFDEMLKMSDWKTGDLGAVAQEIEVSAYPGRYATHIAEADRLYQQIGGTTTVSTSSTCQQDPTQQAILAAATACLSRVGSDYTWSPPPDGASFVSWCYQQAGLTLPTSVDKLANFNGDSAQGLSATWIPANDIKSGTNPLQPGDIPFWADRGTPSRSNVTKTGLDTSVFGNGMAIATYNVRGSTHTPATGPESGPERIKRAAALIESNHFAVVGLQELQMNQRAQLLRSLGSGYGIYPTRPQYGLHQKGINSVNSIIWDKSQVSFVSGGSLPMPYYFNRRSMHIPLVKLLDLKSGQPFFVANTHDPAGDYAHLRYLDALQHAGDADRLTADGTPMFFTGDFNSAYSEHAKVNQVWRHQRQYMTWCVMTRSGRMLDGYDAAQNPVRTGECPPQTTREKGAGPVDHVYVSNNIHVSAYHYIASRQVTASDHGVVYIDAKLPGGASAPSKGTKHTGKYGTYVGVTAKHRIGLMSVSTAHLAGALRLQVSSIETTSSDTGGPWQNPLKVSYVITCTYGYHTCHGNEAHDGVDLAVPVGTPVYAAHSGRIYQAKYGAASGNQIIIDNDGVMGKGYGTKYEHLSGFVPGLIGGVSVSVGQLIGYSGDTGNVTGPHLHFSVCTNTAQCVYGSGVGTSATTDPIPFMRAHGVKL